MLVNKKIYEDDEGKRFIEAIFDSSNILKTLYFEHVEKFYIFFKRGQSYSYVNVDKELYESFENAESQGKFFNQYIRSKPEFECRYEFKLLEAEIKVAEDIIKEFEEKENNERSFINE